MYKFPSTCTIAKASSPIFASCLNAFAILNISSSNILFHKKPLTKQQLRDFCHEYAKHLMGELLACFHDRLLYEYFLEIFYNYNTFPFSLISQRRHVVERHLSDKHPDVNPYVKVIREPENTENVQQSGNQEDTQGDEASTDDGYHWKCNLCEYKCSYKAEMGTHALSVHEEKGQFKCNACSFKTNNKISFEQHLNAKHPYDLNAECFFNYEKMKGSMKKAAPTENTETSNLDEPFDTTPLWRRDMPRVRHIRGILFEDEKPEGKSTKRKSDVEPSAKPAKIKPVKSATSDSSNFDKDSDPLGIDTVSSENSKPEPTLDIAESFRQAEPGSSTFTTVDIAKLIRKFGPLGSPIAVFYRCTICQTFKTKYKHDMRDHLYRDLKYWR